MQEAEPYTEQAEGQPEPWFREAEGSEVGVEQPQPVPVVEPRGGQPAEQPYGQESAVEQPTVDQQQYLAPESVGPQFPWNQQSAEESAAQVAPQQPALRFRVEEPESVEETTQEFAVDQQPGMAVQPPTEAQPAPQWVLPSPSPQWQQPSDPSTQPPAPEPDYPQPTPQQEAVDQQHWTSQPPVAFRQEPAAYSAENQQQSPGRQEPVQHVQAQQEPVQHAPVQQEPVQQEPVQQQAWEQQEAVQHAQAQREPAQQEPVEQEAVQQQAWEQEEPVQHAQAQQEPAQEQAREGRRARGEQEQAWEEQGVPQMGGQLGREREVEGWQFWPPAGAQAEAGGNGESGDGEGDGVPGRHSAAPGENAYRRPN
ncbi:hypothetical protein [Kribbella sp. NPDC055071]